MPIVGSFAGASARAYGLGAGAPIVGDFESIATVTVGVSGQASVEFTSIPATYNHLQIRGIGRTADAVGVRDAVIQFNSDTGANYARHWLYTFDGGTPGSLNSTSATSYGWGYMPGTSSGSSAVSGSIIDILDYANTNKFKTVRTLTGNEQYSAGNSVALFTSGVWLSTSAITSIKIFLTSGNVAQYSSYALYGIKG
jgi:hypothetical protein